MKRIKRAFTLIELLVVVSIISIISFVSINSFFAFISNKEVGLKTEKIYATIKKLDQKVEQKEIFDYEIMIDKNLSASYIVYENVFDREKKIEINFLSGTPSIVTSFLPNEILYKKVYKWEKLEETSTGNNLPAFEPFFDYRIESVLSGTTITALNNVEIIRFDERENTLKLSKVQDTNENEIWTAITLRNLSGKKEILSGGSSYTWIYLHFLDTSKDKENNIFITTN